MVEIKEEYYIKKTSTRIIDSFRNSETTVTEEKFDIENHDNLLIGQVLDLFCQELSRYEHSEGGIVYLMSGTVNQIAESVRDKMGKVNQNE